MRAGRRQTAHVVDYLFVLALFVLFALCSMVVIVIGVNVYRETVDSMSTNYNQRTATAYLTQKLRQSNGQVTLSEVDGAPALIIDDTVDGTPTATTIYVWNGQLKEVYAKAGTPVNPGSGQAIVAVESFTPSWLEPGLLRLNLTTTDGHHQTADVAVGQ